MITAADWPDVEWPMRNVDSSWTGEGDWHFPPLHGPHPRLLARLHTRSASHA